jgi:hypothetical protein
MIGTATSVHRRISLAAGIAYVLTFVSIPTLALYGTVRGASYVTGTGGSDYCGSRRHRYCRHLFPLLKKRNESFALGLVAAQIL